MRVSIFLYRVLTQVWCNFKSRNVTKDPGFNEIAPGISISCKDRLAIPQMSINLIVLCLIAGQVPSGLHQT
jgi:hypothetical protein